MASGVRRVARLPLLAPVGRRLWVGHADEFEQPGADVVVDLLVGSVSSSERDAELISRPVPLACAIGGCLPALNVTRSLTNDTAGLCHL